MGRWPLCSTCGSGSGKKVRDDGAPADRDRLPPGVRGMRGARMDVERGVVRVRGVVAGLRRCGDHYAKPDS